MIKMKLSIEAQIDHMKNQKGILFNIIDEANAKLFLTNNNYYFKLKSYAKNFPQFTTGDARGKYKDLEFAYLQELSTLDMHFRKLILKMTLDIEHYLKTQLLRDFSSNDAEDGYAIVKEFLAANSQIQAKIDSLQSGGLCSRLIQKYNGNFALWNIIEVLSFGDFLFLYTFYYNNYPSKNSMYQFIWSARIMRNAAAHNNCLLNCLSPNTFNPIKSNIAVCNHIAKIPTISRDTRGKRMSNPVMNDFVVTLHLFTKIVSSQEIKKYTLWELRKLVKVRCIRHNTYFMHNELIKSNYEFLRKIVDFYRKDSL